MKGSSYKKINQLWQGVLNKDISNTKKCWHEADIIRNQMFLNSDHLCPLILSSIPRFLVKALYAQLDFFRRLLLLCRPSQASDKEDWRSHGVILMKCCRTTHSFSNFGIAVMVSCIFFQCCHIDLDQQCWIWFVLFQALNFPFLCLWLLYQIRIHRFSLKSAKKKITV